MKKYVQSSGRSVFLESKSFFADIDSKRVHHICYEDFIKQPVLISDKAISFLDLNLENETGVLNLAKTVKKQNAKKFIDPHNYQDEYNLYNNFKKDVL